MRGARLSRGTLKRALRRSRPTNAQTRRAPCGHGDGTRRGSGCSCQAPSPSLRSTTLSVRLVYGASSGGPSRLLPHRLPRRPLDHRDEADGRAPQGTWVLDRPTETGSTFRTHVPPCPCWPGLSAGRWIVPAMEPASRDMCRCGWLVGDSDRSAPSAATVRWASSDQRTMMTRFRPSKPRSSASC